MLYCLIIMVACSKEDRYSRKVVGSWVPYYLSGRWGKKAVWKYKRYTYVFTRGGRYYFLGDACVGDIEVWGRYEIRGDTLHFYYEGHDSTRVTYVGSVHFYWLIEGFGWSPPWEDNASLY